MNDHAEPIEAELVPYEAQPPANLFGVSEPELVIERAQKVATSLKRVLDKQGLTTRISGRDHVLVSGWTLLGSMLGVFPVCVWTHKLEDGWEARVEARTRDGATVGAAEASCNRSENLWRNRDDYALRSMAQTRATAKALRQPLGFVVALAGYDDTPADELPREDGAPSSGPQAPEGAPMISSAQNAKIGAMLRDLEQQYPKPEGQLSWVDDVRNLVGKKSRKDFTKADASKAIEWLQGQLDGEAIPFG